MASIPKNPFNTIPIEIRQAIALNLDADQDLCRFRLICRETWFAIDSDRCSFWRRRFLDVFDTPDPVSSRYAQLSSPDGVIPSFKLQGNTLADNKRFKREYQKRRLLLKNGAHFTPTAKGSREMFCLGVLRDLMVDAFSDKILPDVTKESGSNSHDVVSVPHTSKNIAHIVNFIGATNLLKEIFLPPLQQSPPDQARGSYCTAGFGGLSESTASEQLLHTIQIMMAPALLSVKASHFRHDCWNFPRSQQLAYSTAADWPIFQGVTGSNINMYWVLHNINFWRNHLTRKSEITLYRAFKALAEDEYPQWWDQRLSDADSPDSGSGMRKTIGKRWKGSYAYIRRSEMNRMRAGLGERKMIMDHLNVEDGGDDAFQDVQIEIADDSDDCSPSLPWLPLFERHLRSTTPPLSRARTRAQHRMVDTEAEAMAVVSDKRVSSRFEGTGLHKDEDFQAAGWLNPLPPQHGIPGWQRMTMMKYFVDDGELDEDALWAYEGVALPGGKIIVGRWWSPTDGEGRNMYSGPFILWCVDGSANARDKDLREMPSVDGEDDVMAD